MLPRSTTRILAFIAGFFLITSCRGPATQPAYEPPLEVKPTEPPKRTSTPRATSTPRPLPTATRTFTPPPPGQLNLPPLPDFEGTIISVGMSGGPICDDFYQGVPSAVGGANNFMPARTGALCIYGLRFDSNFRVEMIAPDGSIFLGGNYYVSGDDFGVHWRNFNLSSMGSLADWLGDGPPNFMLIGTAYTRVKINMRWRGDLPNGGWLVRVFTDEGEIGGDFSAIPPEYPSITVVDSRQDWIIPAYSTCHFADQPQDLYALAEGYPPNREIYLYVYEKFEGLVLQSTAWTDSLGSFYVPIRGLYRQNGQYFLIASPEPLRGTSLPDGNLVDCFYVP